METYIDKNKLLIHYFQDSLNGASLEWYMQLEWSHVHSWRNLAEAFLKHYQYNTDLIPNSTKLQDMSQQSNESSKEYTQHWKELAARVQPPPLDKELIYMFMGTLKMKYLEKMVGSSFSTLSDIITFGERIESHINKGKLPSTASASSGGNKPYSNFIKNKEGEANVIMWSRRNGSQHPFLVPYHQVSAITPVQYQ